MPHKLYVAHGAYVSNAAVLATPTQQNGATHSFLVATTAATPAEAFAAIEREAPHLVISDLQLEESDGLAMLEKIRVRLPGVPLILLTGVLFDQQVVASTLSQKVDCYIEKTAPLSRVLAEIKRLTGA